MVAVPGGRAVVPLRAAHQHHAGDRGPLRHAQQLAGDPEGVLALPELDRAGGPRVDQALVVNEPRLRPGLPGVAVLRRPGRLLALYEGFELRSEVFELCRGDDVAKDDEAVVQQLLTVDFHEVSPGSMRVVAFRPHHARRGTEKSTKTIPAAGGRKTTCRLLQPSIRRRPSGGREPDRRREGNRS